LRTPIEYLYFLQLTQTHIPFIFNLIFSVDIDKPVNVLLEEAIEWLLKKYKK